MLDNYIEFNVDRSSVPFFTREIEAIFEVFDPDCLYCDQVDLIQEKMKEEQVLETEHRINYFKLVVLAK